MWVGWVGGMTGHGIVCMCAFRQVVGGLVGWWVRCRGGVFDTLAVLVHVLGGGGEWDVVGNRSWVRLSLALTLHPIPTPLTCTPLSLVSPRLERKLYKGALYASSPCTPFP